MEGLDSLITTMDYILNTPRKRHLLGGILLSASALFIGLAATVLTIKETDDDDQ